MQTVEENLMDPEDAMLPFSKDLENDPDLKLSRQDFQKDLALYAQKYKMSDVEKLKQEPYPSVYLLSRFTKLAYEECNTDNIKLPSDWVVLSVATNSRFLNKYYGVAFCNPKLQQVVLAHRGTVLSKFGSLWTDFNGIYRKKCVGQMSSAATFAAIINTTLQDINRDYGTHFQLSCTGHSLGGWLAQITTFTVKYLKMDKQYFFKRTDSLLSHPHCVVFDNPGCAEMLTKLKRDYDLRYYAPLSLDQLDITCLLSAPNKINTCNHHVGKLYRLKLSFEDMPLSTRETCLYTLYTHDSSALISVFKENEDICSKTVWDVLDWPISGILHNKEYNAFFEHGNASNSFHVEQAVKSLIQSDTGHFYSGVRYKTRNYKEETCSLRMFSQEELRFLEYWDALVQKGVKLTLIHEFFFEKLQYPEGLLTSFEINIKDGVLSCNTREDLQKTVRNCKQLIRWFNKEIFRVLKEQTLSTPSSFLAMFHTATVNYIVPIKDIELEFRDVIGLEAFLKSEDHHVMNLIANPNCTQLEQLRLYKIFNQIGLTDKTLKMYTADGRYVFIDWKHFVALHRFINIDSIFQASSQIHLIVIDFLHNLVFENEAEKEIFLSMLNLIVHLSKENRKKIIFLSSDSYDKEMITKSVINLLMQREINSVKANNITFSDLQYQSQLLVLDNIFVRFQSDSWSLKEILNLQNNTHFEGSYLKSFIDSKVLSFLISEGLHLEICNTLPRLCESEVSQARFYKDFTFDEFKNFISLQNSAEYIFIVTYMGLENLSIENTDTVKLLEVSNDEEAFEQFMKCCHSNQDKQIFWFKIDSNCVCLQRLYNAEFYIQRRFRYQFVLKTSMTAKRKREYCAIAPPSPLSVPKAENPDLFIFSNVADENRLLFVQKLKSIISLVEENIVVVNSKNEAQEIFDKKESQSRRSVHWFHVEQEDGYEKHVWLCSKGSLENLYNHIMLNKMLSLNESQLCSKDYKTLIIADGPGAGKSTTLTHIFGRMKNSWVIRINLMDCEFISKLNIPINIDEVVNILLPKRVSYKLQDLSKSLLKHFLLTKSKISVFVLFDDFDEIRGTAGQSRKELENKVIQLLKFLKYKTTANVWVTTRDNKKEQLEDSLSTFAIEFQQIEKENLEEFLKVFWRSKLYLELCDSNFYSSSVKNAMAHYIKELFQRAKQVFGSDIDQFIGVPLQIRILAEVVAPSLTGLTKSDYVIQIPTDILELFHRFTEGKYEIYFRHKTRLSVVLNDVTKLWFIELLSSKHTDLAWRKVFLDQNETFNKYSYEELLELNIAGLIQLSNSVSKFDFIDRTVADYFVSNRLVEILRTNNAPQVQERYGDIESFLLKTVFLQPVYNIVRQFLDCHFSKIYSPVSEMESYTNQISPLLMKHETDILGFSKFSPPLFKMQDYASRICHLLTKNEIPLMFYDKLNRTPFHILVSEKCSYLLQFLLDALLENSNSEENLASIHELRDTNNETAFHLALHSNTESSIRQYLSLIANCENDNIKERLLLATIFREPKDCESKEFKLLSEYISLYEEYKSLTDIISRIKEKFTYMNLFLKAAETGDLVKLEDCLHQIGDANYKDYLLLSTDEDGNTAILVAIISNREAAVDYLIEAGCNIKRENKFGMTTLAWSAKVGNLKLVKYFKVRGCSFEKPDRNGINPMQHAAKNGHNEVLRYFIEDLQVNVNYKDFFGNSALAWASKCGELENVKYLISQNADIESENRHRMRPLHMAIKAHKWDVIEELVKKGADVKVHDGYDISPLHRAIKTRRWGIVKLLIQKGADIKDCDNLGKTAEEYLISMKKQNLFETKIVNKNP